MGTEQFDVIVIGAGQGGGPLASAFANSGRKTALIEREYPGGTCVNFGCTPTKTMIASGRVAHLARRGNDYGVATGKLSIDMEKVRQRKRDMVESFRSGSRSGIDGTDGLVYIEGEASFTGNKQIKIALNAGGTRELRAETFVIDVGERDRRLEIEGADDVTLEDTRSIQELDHVPNRLLIVGGGPISLEFAQLYRRLGSEVVIINRGPSLLSREDQDISDAVADILIEDGIEIVFNSVPTKVERDGTGIILTAENKDGKQRDISGSHIMVAAGRVPNSDSLNLDQTGVEVDEKGYIPTNSHLETNVSGIYAVGDVRPGPKFTHISYDDYRILKANLVDGEQKSIDGRLVPATTFIDPQLGTIGLSEKDAKDQGVPYRVATMPMSSVARALETDETRGLMKVLVHADTDRIIGAAILGIEGGEIVSMIQIAMMGELPYTTLRDGVFAHPGLAESLNNLFGSLQEPQSN